MQDGSFPLTYIEPNKIAIAIIKGKDGKDYVYNWCSEREKLESWEDYVRRSKEETIAAIRNLDAEKTVAEEFKDRIYYNLVYANKDEFENLNQWKKLKGSF